MDIDDTNFVPKVAFFSYLGQVLSQKVSFFFILSKLYDLAF